MDRDLMWFEYQYTVVGAEYSLFLSQVGGVNKLRCERSGVFRSDYSGWFLLGRNRSFVDFVNRLGPVLSMFLATDIHAGHCRRGATNKITFIMMHLERCFA